jgi:hypothetical protein
MLPLGLALAGIGIAGLGGVAIERRRRIRRLITEEVASG